MPRSLPVKLQYFARQVAPEPLPHEQPDVHAENHRRRHVPGAELPLTAVFEYDGGVVSVRSEAEVPAITRRDADYGWITAGTSPGADPQKMRRSSRDLPEFFVRLLLRPKPPETLRILHGSSSQAESRRRGPPATVKPILSRTWIPEESATIGRLNNRLRGSS